MRKKAAKVFDNSTLMLVAEMAGGVKKKFEKKEDVDYTRHLDEQVGVPVGVKYDNIPIISMPGRITFN